MQRATVEERTTSALYVKALSTFLEIALKKNIRALDQVGKVGLNNPKFKLAKPKGQGNLKSKLKILH